MDLFFPPAEYYINISANLDEFTSEHITGYASHKKILKIEC